MDATLMLSDQIGILVPTVEAETSEQQLRYRIAFADGSIGTRHYDEPLRIGDRIVGAGTSVHLISSIEQEPEYGGLGRASAVPAERS
ncbi:MAG TPA: hypothetical protein VG652_08200 [Gaiellaceae bacterium]|nr:hypothetical protein [Gaiellaceae bacterium]